MEIVDLVCRGSLPLKEGESYVGERSCLRSAPREVFPLHESVIGRGRAERDPVAPVVGAHAGEIGAPGDQPLEVVDVGRLQLRARRLVMTAVLVQPGYRIRVGAAVVGAQFRRRLLIIRSSVARKQQRRCSCRRDAEGGD